MVRAARSEHAHDYVIATGVGHSVRDFVDAAFRRAGIDDWSSLVSVDAEFTRPADASDLTGDASRARDELGWTPTLDFAEIVGRMVDEDLDSGLSGDHGRSSRSSR
jgi:GDPmannose 4,6-dehydratase